MYAFLFKLFVVVSSFIVVVQVCAQSAERRNIGILIYDGFFTSEVTASVEVFGRASHSFDQPFNILLIASGQEPITSNEGLTLTPNATYEDAPKLDVLVVTSGSEMGPLLEDDKLLGFIKSRFEEASYVASHCDGARLLGKAGVLKGRKIITWIGGSASLQEEFPEAKVGSDEKSVLEDGKLVSSNGELVTYEASLRLLEKLSGKEIADQVAQDLYYDRLVRGRTGMND